MIKGPRSGMVEGVGTSLIVYTFSQIECNPVTSTLTKKHYFFIQKSTLGPLEPETSIL